jgi:hypothetical protein
MGQITSVTYVATHQVSPIIVLIVMASGVLVATVFLWLRRSRGQ